jgi:hypothetical protein
MLLSCVRYLPFVHMAHSPTVPTMGALAPAGQPAHAHCPALFESWNLPASQIRELAHAVHVGWPSAS